MDDEKEYVIEAELPGLDKKDIEIVLSEGRLKPSSTKEETEESNKKTTFIANVDYQRWDEQYCWQTLTMTLKASMRN